MTLTNITLWGSELLGAAAEAEGESHGFSLMDIHVGTVFWTLVIFVIVLFVMGRFVWKPILKAIEDREERIRSSLNKADEAKAEFEKALSDQKELMNKQRREANELIGKAKEDAQIAGQEIVANAHREAEEQTKRARRQIEEEKTRALTEVRTQAVDLALEAASHLLGKVLDKERHKSIVKEYIQQLPEHMKEKH